MRAAPGLLLWLLLTACRGEPGAHEVSLAGAALPCDVVVWPSPPPTPDVHADIARVLWGPLNARRDRRGLTNVTDDGRFELDGESRYDIHLGTPSVRGADDSPRALLAVPNEPAGDDDRTTGCNGLGVRRPRQLTIGPWRVAPSGHRAVHRDTGATVSVDGEIVAITEDGRHLAASSAERGELVFVRDGTPTYRVRARIRSPRRTEVSLHRPDAVVLSPSGRFAAWNDASGAIGALDLDLGILYGDAALIARVEAAR